MPQQDVERVVDDERAHEHRNQRERQQDVAEDADHVAELVLVLLDDHAAADRLDVIRERSVEPLEQHVVVEPGLAVDIDPLDLTLGAVEALELAHRERHQCCAGQGVLLAEPGQAHQGEWLAARDANDVVDLADHKVLAVGASLVHHELTRSVGFLADNERERAQRRFDPVERQYRWAVLEGVTVGLDRHDLLALQAGQGFGDSVDRSHDLDERFVEGAFGGLDLGEVVIRPDLGIDVGVGLLDDVVERPQQTVGEHEGRHDKAHAEKDGERGQSETQLVARQIAEAEADHLAHGSQTSSDLIRSITWSAVGSTIWPTSLPSRRKTTRSA